MGSLLAVIVLFAGAETAPAPKSASSGERVRTLSVDGRDRTYRYYLPAGCDPAKPTPVVLVYHGALTNGRITVSFTGMNEKADREKFCVVYPDGTGRGRFALTWNSGGIPVIAEGKAADDVKYTRALLDDLATVIQVDARRTFATGMSNGGMMCHRLAIELPDRIAAIAPVGGTLAVEHGRPTARVPVLQIHGTVDEIVPWEGRRGRLGEFNFLSVDATIEFWVKQNGCVPKPRLEKLPDIVADHATAVRYTYLPQDVATGGEARQRSDAEVILVKIEGGGHTWPGRTAPIKMLGPSTADVIANDVIWEFFRRHPMPLGR